MAPPSADPRAAAEEEEPEDEEEKEEEAPPRRQEVKEEEAKKTTTLRERWSKLWTHYGPPYHDEYGGSLVEECQEASVSLRSIHDMLNSGGDPRIGDPKNFHMTPMHYAARSAEIKFTFRYSAT